METRVPLAEPHHWVENHPILTHWETMKYCKGAGMFFLFSIFLTIIIVLDKRGYYTKYFSYFFTKAVGLDGSVWCVSNWRSGGRRRVQQHPFVEIDHAIFSTVILSLLLIQEGQLSVFGKKNVHKYWLTASWTKPAQKKMWLDKLTMLNMTPKGWLCG